MIYQKSTVNNQKTEAGFTMIELMITMVIFVLAIAAASQIFTKLLTQFKQQSKVAETNIEGIVGLDLLRQDIEHAGLGLPWNITGVAYTEATNINYCDPEPTTCNDAPGDPPRAFISGDGAGPGVDESDYFVIKSATAAINNAAGINTRLTSDGNVRDWSLYDADDLEDTDRVIVISPGSTASNSRALVVTGGSFNTSYDNVSSYAPADNTDVRLVYGISPANATNALRAPFNRADYYISAANVPPRCATGTGVLVKATLNQATGDLDVMPILDCVADLQVIYDLDTDNNGTIDTPLNDISALAAPEDIREQIKNVQVYILAHEGQKDTNFTFNNFTGGGTSVIVGRTAALGRAFDFDDIGIADYTNYRWKVYNISVQTGNLR